VSREEIRDAFADGWQVVSIEASMIETTFEDGDMHAWFATITRV
jgi:hypothetical protein